MIDRANQRLYYNRVKPKEIVPMETDTASDKASDIQCFNQDVFQKQFSR